MAAASAPLLVELLEEAQRRGLLGPGDPRCHARHGEVWGAGLEPASEVLDLGSGAGLPGLVLALRWPEARITLVDANRRRCAWLEVAVRELHIGGRATVVCGRAEELGHDRGLREAWELVVARGFGAPAVTCECAAAFCRVGGRLSVSEPPGPRQTDRWSAAGLGDLGLAPARWHRAGSVGWVTIDKMRHLDRRFPRRAPALQRRPLWRAPGDADPREVRAGGSERSL